ncbi:hypothetical protein F8M41_025261 [Gigaspora margarita]|uniref:Uncharacterized protein n=1 Tax=Gigaspora margarita TaxID=4874 RepID=A0A8H3XL07_GIGMA|nr:hypothetical protein F8M41_025261 [Gigaspora margarita]
MSTNVNVNDYNKNNSITINKYDLYNDKNKIDKIPALQLTFSNQNNQISKSLPSPISYVDRGQITSTSTASGSRSSSASDSNNTDISLYSESISSAPPTYPEYGESLNSFGEIDNSLKGKTKEIILDINDTCLKLQQNKLNSSSVDIGSESLKDTSYNLKIGSTLHRPPSNIRSYNVYEVLAEIRANTTLSRPQYQKQVSKSVHNQQQKTGPFSPNKSKGNKTYDKKNNLELSVNDASTVVIAKYMFWLGWLIMPIWWIGSFYLPRPTSEATPDDYKWRNRCRKASTWGFIGLILVGLFVVILKTRIDYDDDVDDS